METTLLVRTPGSPVGTLVTYTVKLAPNGGVQITVVRKTVFLLCLF